MSENGNNNDNAQMLLILNQPKEQITVLTHVNKLKNGHYTENEDEEEDDNRNTKSYSQNPPPNTLRQVMEQFMKRVKASPAFKDSYPHYDDCITAPKRKVPAKFALPDYLKFTGVEDPHHTWKVSWMLWL